MSATKHSLQCRILTDYDRHRAIAIERELKSLAPQTIALFLSAALNELDEQRSLCRNQRVRLGQMEAAAKGIPKPRDVAKYFSPQESGDTLAAIREKFSQAERREDRPGLKVTIPRELEEAYNL